MFLEKLEISGFKSFATKIILMFPKPYVNRGYFRYGISAIVGPNGSGKSNIADAIRWALGEQSLKILRGKKSEDVIFSGSDKKAKLGLAEVSLYINNEDGAFPIDYPEVLIGRRVYRNGEGEYILNKNIIRLTDLLMLLARANFGQKSYSVIGQGMVDDILNSTPQERKEYFDEAVGVRQYQLKREQSARKLERTWENLKQVKAILDEIKPRLNSLTRQVRKLERREELERQLLDTQKKLYGILWNNIRNQKETLEPKINKVTREASLREQQLRAVEKELEVLEKQDSRTEEFNRLQKRHQRLLDEKNNLKEKNMILKNKIDLARQRAALKSIPLPHTQILSQLREIHNLEDQLLQNIEKCQTISELRNLKEPFFIIQKKLKDLISELEHPSQNVQIQNEIQGYTKDLDELKNATENSEHLLNEILAEITKFNQSQDQQKGKFFKLQREFQEKHNLYNQSSQQLSELRIELTRIETHKEDLENEIQHELKSTDWLSEYSIQGQVNTDFLLSEISRFKHQLELIGGIDSEMVSEYKKTKERYDFLKNQSEDLSRSIQSLRTIIIDLDETIQKQFQDAFKKINTEFQKYFKVLFSGGKAELSLIREDTEEIEEEKRIEAASEGVDLEKSLEYQEDEELKKLFLGKSEKVIRGIEIIATPPGKKVKNISMLSGGERALTSIALICAIISHNPSPFVLLDEVDAALDEANSERFATIINELSCKTQFVIITHNRATMHKADILYGVTMGDDGISKILSLKLEEAEKQTSMA